MDRRRTFRSITRNFPGPARILDQPQRQGSQVVETSRPPRFVVGDCQQRACKDSLNLPTPTRSTDQDVQCASPECWMRAHARTRAGLQRNYPIDRGNVEVQSAPQHFGPDVGCFFGGKFSQLLCRLHSRMPPVGYHGHCGLRDPVTIACQVIRWTQTRAVLL